MDFCDNCGKLLGLGKDFSGSAAVRCTFCGEGKILGEVKVSEIKVFKESVGEGVLDQAEHDLSEGFPHICKKCGHGEADVHDWGIGYSDESSIHFFRCKKCGFIERQSDGTGNK